MRARVLASKNPFKLKGCQPVSMEASCVSEIVDALDGPLRTSEYTSVWVDGSRIDRAFWGDPLESDCNVVVTAVPQGIVEGLTVGQLVTITLIQMAVAAAVGFVISLLFPPPKPTRARDDESSPTYNFQGISQNRNEHGPVEVAFGEMRTGGTIIGEYIRSTYSPVTSTLYQLVSFGWGPFQSVAGQTEDTPPNSELPGSDFAGKIFINENPIENYDDVYVQVRLGNNEQEPIAGFEQLVVPEAVGPFALTSEEVTGAGVDADAELWDQSTYDWADPTTDPHWDEYARTYDVTAAYDELVLRLRPSGGYYSSNASGELTGAPFKYAIRYQELDGSNAPITTGGDNNDGWYREPPNMGIGFPVFSQQGQFDFEVRVPLRDPQTSAIGASGSAAGFISDQADRMEADVDAGNPLSLGDQYPPGSANRGLGVSAWFKLDSAGIIGSSNQRIYLIGSEAATGSQTATSGWTVYLRSVPNPSAGINYVSVIWKIWSQNGQVSTPVGFGPSFAQGLWNHIYCEWFVSSDGAIRRNRIYINGVLAANVELPNNQSLIPPTWSDTPLCIGRNHAQADFMCTGTNDPVKVDAVRIFNTNLQQSQVTALYNEGVGASIGGPSIPQINSEWMIEADPDTNTAAPVVGDPDPWWGSLDITGDGGTLEAGSGIVDTVEPGEIKRMKARIQIVRTNVDSTSTRTRDDMEWVEVQGVTYAGLSYPNHALMAFRIEATEQLGGRIPQSSAINECLKVPIWDGVNTDNPSYSLEYTRNPAWHAASIVQGANLYKLPGDYRVDIAETKALADYCDELVYDGTRPIVSTGTADNAICENIWYTPDFIDPVSGQDRGLITIHVVYRDQTTGETINGSLPKEWVPGHYIRLRNLPDDTDPGINYNGNTPEDSSPNGVGGYEIYSIGLDTLGTDHPPGGGATVAYAPGYHVIKCFAVEPGEITVGSWWTGQNDDDLTLTGSMGDGTGDADDKLPAGWVVEGAGARFEFNGIYDTTRGAWDALGELLSVCRAAPVKEGNLIRFRYSHPQEPVALITNSAIEEGSFKITYTDRKERFNSFDLLFLNRAKLFEQDTATVIDDSVVNPTDLNEIRRDQRELFGVTDYGQASRHGNFEANANRLLIRTGEFSIGPSALSLQVGDTVRLSSDLLPRGSGGYALNAEPGTQTTLADGSDFTTGSWPTSGNLDTVVSSGTDVFGSTSYKLEDSDITKLGYVLQGTGAGIAPGVYCLSVVAKNDSGNGYFRMEMADTSNASSPYWALFNLVSGEIESENKGMDGGATITDIDGSTYFLTIWVRYVPVTPSSQIRIAFYPAPGSSGSDITEIGSALVSNAALCEGKYPLFDAGLARRGVTIDRPLTVAGSDTLYVQDRSDVMQSRTLLTGQFGDFQAGESLFTETAFDLGFEPGRYDPYLAVTSGDELVVEITSMSLGAGLVSKVEFVEYNEAIYEDRSDDGQIIELSNDNHGGASGGVSSGKGQLRPPGNPTITGVDDWNVKTANGSWTSHIKCSWEPVKEDLMILQEYRIWGRAVDSENARWQLMGTSAPGDRFADVACLFGAPGEYVEVAVQPVTRFGMSRSIERCARSRIYILGMSTQPAALVSAEAREQAGYARYDWELPADDTQLSVECRRGGWVLGYRVFTSSPGSLDWGRNRDWVGSDYTTPKLYFCALHAGGQYSQPLVVEYEPSPYIDTEKVPDLTDQTRRWETFAQDEGSGSGWVKDVPVAGDPVLGPEFDEDANEYIHWDPTSTETTDPKTVWESTSSRIIPISGNSGRENRMCYVEAYWEAEQVHSLTWEYAAGAWSDSVYSTWTWEGPSSPLPSKGEVTLWMEVSINEDGTSDGWSGFRRYQPGLYSLVDVRFRLRATRPDTDFDMRLMKLHTRITAPGLSIEQATPQRRGLDQEIL